SCGGHTSAATDGRRSVGPDLYPLWPVVATPRYADVPVTAGTWGRFCASSTGRGQVVMYELLMRPLIRLQIAVVELRDRQEGQTTTEYAILLGFLAIAIIIALFFLRNVLRSLFSNAASSVSGAPDG